jgi:flagellar biosynthesis/type III secretory pathway chaperone
MVQVKDKPYLWRSEDNGAINNINLDEIRHAKQQKMARLERQRRTEELEKTVSGLKEDFKDIKSLLSQLIESNNNGNC